MNNYPRLIADIGGTNARFCIEKSPFELLNVDVLPCASFDTLLIAIKTYLEKNALNLPKHVGIAIANPVNGDYIRMTNHHWHFSINEMQAELGVDTLLVVNDFMAQALAITQMPSDHFTSLSSGQVTENSTPINQACAVIGPGTGLGVSGLIPDGRGGFVALAGEGGHVTFAPTNDTERALMDFAARRFKEHVSIERILQGDGIMLMYHFFAERRGIDPQKFTPADITHGALHNNDPICIEVLSHYCSILGSFCANTVLTLGGIGGVYLTGGILPRFVDFLCQSDFRTRFESKGRFADYLSVVPVYIVEHEQPGLLGAAVALNNYLTLSTREDD